MSNNDDQFAKKVAEAYQELLRLRDNNDYVENPIQMDRLFKVYEFFKTIAEKNEDGHVEISELVPKMEHGCVSAKFVIFGIYEEDMAEFSQIISYLSAFEVTALENGDVCVEVTVPEVFIRKDKKVSDYLS